MAEPIYPVITIDGPAGTGKGTIGQLVAKALGWHLLDSGALYRVLALAAKQHSVEFGNAMALQVLAAHLDVQFKASELGGLSRIILEGVDVTDAIRTTELGNAASQVASVAEVRTALLARQRAFRVAPGLVADGRDMGSVIFPDARLKVYLIASQEERAKRRYLQLKDKGINVNLARILEEISERDARDAGRAVAPLKPAADAFIVDTTGLTIEQVFAVVMAEIGKRLIAAEA